MVGPSSRCRTGNAVWLFGKGLGVFIFILLQLLILINLHGFSSSGCQGSCVKLGGLANSGICSCIGLSGRVSSGFGTFIITTCEADSWTEAIDEVRRSSGFGLTKEVDA